MLATSLKLKAYIYSCTNCVFFLLALTSLNAQSTLKDTSFYCNLDLWNSDDLENNLHQTYLELSHYNERNSNYAVEKRINYSYTLDSSYHITLIEQNSVQVEAKLYYHFENNRDIISIMRIDESNNYQPDAFIVQSYNDNGLLVKHTYNPWKSEDTSWVEDSSTVIRDYIYNENQLLTEIQEYDFLDIPQDKIDNKTVLHYDNLNTLLGFSRFFYDSALDSMVHTKEVIYDYYSNNNLKYIKDFNVVDNLLIPEDSIHYTYNHEEDLINEIEFKWINDSFILIKETINTYDSDRVKLTEFNYESFDTLTQSWRSLERNYYQYYESGDLFRIVTTDSIPPPVYSELIYEARFKYDENILFNDVKVYRSWVPDYNQMNMLKEESYYFHGYTTENWGLDFRNTYFISEFDPVSINPEVESGKQILIFPNPSHDWITVRIGNTVEAFKVNLFDSAGRIVLSTRFVSGEKLDVSSLDKGLYYYDISSKQESYSGSLFINK